MTTLPRGPVERLLFVVFAAALWQVRRISRTGAPGPLSALVNWLVSTPAFAGRFK